MKIKQLPRTRRDMVRHLRRFFKRAAILEIGSHTLLEMCDFRFGFQYRLAIAGD